MRPKLFERQRNREDFVSHYNKDPRKICVNFSQVTLPETNESNPLLVLETYLSILSIQFSVL